MSILTWLKSVSSSHSTALMEHPLKFAPGEEEFHGLDMRDALNAHVQWTHRLEDIISGKSDEQPEVGTVASDCHCLLGKWIHGYAKQQFEEHAEYQELKRLHADFHLSAGQILNSIQNGEMDDAKLALKELRFKSGNVQLALVRLYALAHEND